MPELTPKTPDSSRPGVPYTGQAIIRRDSTSSASFSSFSTVMPFYDPESGSDISITKFASLKLGIKGSDVPQWLWTREECRVWLYAVLVDYLNVSKLVTLNSPL
jgi:hypothetical protein